MQDEASRRGEKQEQGGRERSSWGTQVGGDTESFPGDGQRLSCKGDNCHELLVGGLASGGVQDLSRSQRIYGLVMCGRESAHRWEEGWTDGWRQDFLSGSVPLQYRPGTCGPRSQAASFQLHHPPETCPGVVSLVQKGPGAALLLAWLLLPVSCGGLLEVIAGCLREQGQGTHWSPLSA